MQDPIESDLQRSVLDRPEAQANTVIEYKSKILGLQNDLRLLQSQFDELIQATTQAPESQNLETGQLSILITRLRQERDEAKSAVQFLNVEHASLVQASQNAIATLRDELRHQIQTSNAQRNELVLAMALISNSSSPVTQTHDGMSVLPTHAPPNVSCTGCISLEGKLAGMARQLDTQRHALNADSTRASISTLTMSPHLIIKPEQEAMQIESTTAMNMPCSLQNDGLPGFTLPEMTSTDANQTTLIEPLVSTQDLLSWEDCHISSDPRPDSPVMLNEASVFDILGDLTQQDHAIQGFSNMNNSLNIHSLQMQINRLNGTITGLQARAQENCDLVNTRDEELRKMEKQLSFARTDASSYQLTLATLEDEIANLKTEVTELRARESDLKTDLANFKLQLEEKNKIVVNNLEVEGEEPVRIPSKDLIQTQKALQETQKIVSQLKEAQTANEVEMEELEKHCSTLCVQLQQKSDELTEAESRLKSIQTDIEEANKQRESRQTELSDQLVDTSAKLAALEREAELNRSSLENEIQVLKTSIHELESSKAFKNELDTTRADFSQQLASASAQLEISERIKEESVVAYEVKIAGLSARVEELTSENRTLADQLERHAGLEKEHELARADISDQLVVANAQLVDLQREKQVTIASFETQIRELNLKVDELRSDNEKLCNQTESILQADTEHERTRAELLEQLAIASTKLANQQAAEDTIRSTFEHEIRELKAKVDELETEKRDLADQLTLTIKSSESIKQVASDNLTQARAELEILRDSSDAQAARYAEAERELERLRLEIGELKVQQAASHELEIQFDVLVAEFDTHQNKWQQSSDEVEVLRTKVEEYSKTNQALLSDIDEKEGLINSLKADLATVSKLHRNMPSLVELGEKINDLEARLLTKTNEAEDALDRLIDEMQKNKRLLNLVENLKVKLKTKDKSAPVTAKEESRQSTPVNEPIGPPILLPSPATRKRKLDYIAATSAASKANSISRIPINAKENSVTNSESSIPRKTILHPKLESRESSGDDVKADTLPLQVVRSINQMEEDGGSRRKLRERTVSGSHVSKPGSQTNANLLANIQSLRKKQQQQASNMIEGGNNQNSIKR